ncbi:hypothetical protein F0562_005013 [Nyssa sinensis]|uniref:USP domain-containing protein n=1 Tax=Nyssa sinensis TaxID=561372 RepID=A0A5J5AJ66_9ASTE|nr:hypothetical protein F0562_005013 [Nyssa sinensis]
MGRKKRNTPLLSKPPPPDKSDASHAGVSPTTGSIDDLRQEQSKNEPLNSTSFASSITIECERALTALQGGNPAEAIPLIKDACLRHETSVLLHLVQGTVYAKVASLMDDNVRKERHLKKAAESARKAVSLLPNLLNEASNDFKDYRRVFLIDNPIYPAKDSLQEDSQLKVSTAEARIVTVRHELLSLIEESEDAATSPLEDSIENPKNGDGEEQFWLIPTSRPMEDPMEASLIQTTRPNEIKATQTPEKPTEIEVRVAAARLLQPKREDDEERSFKDCLADEILSEAIGFAEKNKTWRFWACCSCDEKFVDSESHIQHLQSEHMGNLSPELQSILPLKVDADWFEMFLTSQWKPVDAPAAVTIIRSQSKNQLDNLPDEDCPIESPFKESSKAKLLNELLKQWQVFNGVESRIHDEYSQFGLSEFDWSLWSMVRPNDWKWPLSNNSDSTEILEKIRGMLKLLLRHEYLAVSHLNEMIQYTMKELQTFLSSSQIMIYGLEETPLCICFLEVSQLKSALAFLQELSHICGLSMFSEKSSTTDDAHNGKKSNEIKEKIVFTGDLSCLLVDERLLHKEHHFYYDEAAAHDGSAAACAVGDHEVAVLPDSDAFVYWLFGGPPIEEQLASWKDTRDDKKYQGIQILQVLDKEFLLLQSLCEKKSEHLSHRKAWQIIESICVEEVMKREQGERYSPQSYGALLRKRQEELVQSDYDSMSSSSRVELSVISSILDAAQAIKVNQFRVEETLIDASSLHDLKCSEDNEYRMPDYLHLEENCIKLVILWQMPKTHAKLCEIDARILRILTDMNQLENKIVQVSAHDYRSIMLPLVKSFMLARFEDFVDRDTTQKSDAAREIAELVLDGKKNINQGGDQTKYTQQELKERKFEESLKYQRQIENEAELEQLEEQNKKSCGTIPAKLAETLPVIYFGTIPEKFGEAVPVVYSKPSDVGEPATRHSGDKYSDGMPAQGTLEDSVLPYDQQTGGLHDALEAQTKFPSMLMQRMPQKVSSKEDRGVLSTDATVQSMDGSDISVTGLRNDVGENNCFLNVIIQSLWHLRRFQHEFLSRSTSMHVHIGEPCVVCALYEIFKALNAASKDMQREAVAPTSLRVALSNLNADSNLFQLAQMNDASEVLGVIFDSLHQSFTSNCDVSDTVSEESKSMGSWNCASKACIVHTLFGMDIFERMECSNCGVVSRKMKYTTFFHNINANALRTVKTMHGERLLKLEEMNNQLPCDPEAGGCGKLNRIHYKILKPPHVFTIVIGWQTAHESEENISATLTAFTSEIDIANLYRGLDSGNRHCLVSVVCYCRRHYICFAYSHDDEEWIVFDDENVKVIGCWNDVLSMCVKRQLQPQAF